MIMEYAFFLTIVPFAPRGQETYNDNHWQVKNFNMGSICWGLVPDSI